MIAYHLQMTTKVSDHRYDLGDKGQGQMLRPVTRTALLFLDGGEGDHVLEHNDCLWYVDDKNTFKLL